MATVAQTRRLSARRRERGDAAGIAEDEVVLQLDGDIVRAEPLDVPIEERAASASGPSSTSRESCARRQPVSRISPSAWLGEQADRGGGGRSVVSFPDLAAVGRRRTASPSGGERCGPA